MLAVFSRWLRVVLWFGCLASSSISARVQAQSEAPPAPPPSGLLASDNYKAVIREALAEFEEHHYQESRALFMRAHELQPSARTWRGIGFSAFELRDYVDSVNNLEQALASTERPLQGELRSDTVNMLERSYGFVGRYTVALAPSNAVLVVDDVETSLHDGARLMLSIGHHVVEARAPAYQPDKRALEVAGHENTGLSFSLAPVPVPVLPVVVASPAQAAQTVVEPAPIDTQQRSDKHLYKNPWLWAASGAVVVVVIVVAAVAAGRDTQVRERDPVLTNPNGPVITGLVVAP